MFSPDYQAFRNKLAKLKGKFMWWFEEGKLRAYCEHHHPGQHVFCPITAVALEENKGYRCPRDAMYIASSLGLPSDDAKRIILAADVNARNDSGQYVYNNYFSKEFSNEEIVAIRLDMEEILLKGRESDAKSVPVEP